MCENDVATWTEVSRAGQSQSFKRHWGDEW